ncbi:unnamed protein product, partial [Rotaria socialis]
PLKTNIQHADDNTKYHFSNSSNGPPVSLSSLTNQDSPSPISSQNSTSGDDSNSIYNRSQQ